LWLIPIVLLHTVGALLILPLVDDWVSSVFPLIAPPPGFELGEFLQSPEAGPLFLGNWGILGMFLVMITFNILGEEFLWRGVLLPRMNGVFGKWDWVANGVLGTLYHVSMPWSWLGTTGISTGSSFMPCQPSIFAAPGFLSSRMAQSWCSRRY
jgi:membrane protease YdiL (CAAX protease family)